MIAFNLENDGDSIEGEIYISIDDVLDNSKIYSISFDTEFKRVELLEPHGYKSKDSTVEGISSAYYNKAKAIKHFFKKVMPNFKFINTVDIINKPSFQANFDAHSGYCVTWSILYAHYRILNPDVPLEKLIEYMDSKVNTQYLLKYAAYIEEVLKGKN